MAEIHKVLLLILHEHRRACGHVHVETCPHQVLAVTLTLSQPGQIMPTLYWGPWLAKIRRGGPGLVVARISASEKDLPVLNI